MLDCPLHTNTSPIMTSSSDGRRARRGGDGDDAGRGRRGRCGHEHREAAARVRLDGRQLLAEKCYVDRRARRVKAPQRHGHVALPDHRGRKVRRQRERGRGRGREREGSSRSREECAHIFWLDEAFYGVLLTQLRLDNKAHSALGTFILRYRQLLLLNAFARENGHRRKFGMKPRMTQQTKREATSTYS